MVRQTLFASSRGRAAGRGSGALSSASFRLGALVLGIIFGAYAGISLNSASLTNSLLSSHLLAKEQLEFLNRDGRAHASVASPPVSDDSNSHTTPTTLLEHPTLETKPSSTTRSAQPQRTDASARTGSSGNAAVTESEVLQETELDGSVVMPGLDNLVESAAECQRSCRASFDQNIVGCNVWVYSERTRQCWLKRQDDVANGLRSRAKGHGVPWSSGYIKGPIVTNPFQEQNVTDTTPPFEVIPGLSVHVVVTSNGNPYMNWQMRLYYQSYLRVRQEPGSVLKALTRVLHRSTPDELMFEVPSVVIPPLHVECDAYCWYPVEDRAQAIVDWLKTEDSRRCSHIMLAETDYVFHKSLSSSAIPRQPRTAVGFPFHYIAPKYPRVKAIVERLNLLEGEATLDDVPSTGNAPFIISHDDLSEVAPLWAKLMQDTIHDREAVIGLGWLRDMYAFSIALARRKIKVDLTPVPRNLLMTQPPHDDQLGEAAMLHYTWGALVYTVNGNQKIWEFDKRLAWGGQNAPSPRKMEIIPRPPDFDPKEPLRLQDNMQITRARLNMLHVLTSDLNLAIAALPDKQIPQGFPDAKTAHVASLPSKEVKALVNKMQEKARKDAQFEKSRGIDPVYGVVGVVLWEEGQPKSKAL
mmetsp:Transcript_1119/g.3930  ORF Transcript_1119/g.3930 Transcript_1119/m.3930 type:complete len:639 (+) Transcript_1119:116-2032(+)